MRYRSPNARRLVHKRIRYKCGECDYEKVDAWIYHQLHYEFHRRLDNTPAPGI